MFDQHQLQENQRHIKELQKEVESLGEQYRSVLKYIDNPPVWIELPCGDMIALRFIVKVTLERDHPSPEIETLAYESGYEPGKNPVKPAWVLKVEDKTGAISRYYYDREYVGRLALSDITKQLKRAYV